jgi:hypothetical protein
MVGLAIATISNTRRDNMPMTTPWWDLCCTQDGTKRVLGVIVEREYGSQHSRALGHQAEALKGQGAVKQARHVMLRYSLVEYK